MRHLLLTIVMLCYSLVGLRAAVYQPRIASESEVSVFFEADASVSDAPRLWVWGSGDGTAYLGTGWDNRPSLTYMGFTTDGKLIYKWTYNGTLSAPTGLIFSWNNGANRADLTFTNHGYYKLGQLQSTVSASAKAYAPVVETQSEVSIFFETDASVNDAPRLWVWGEGDGTAYLGTSWDNRPSLTYVGATKTGYGVYKWTYNGSMSAPTGLILTWNNGDKRVETTFTNHGYYTLGQLTSTIAPKNNSTNTGSAYSDVCLFFEANSSIADAPRLWVYSSSVGGDTYLGSDWGNRPQMTYMGKTSAGNSVYKWAYTGSKAMPTDVIFTWNSEAGRSEQSFVNHGYYVAGTYSKTVSQPSISTQTAGKSIYFEANANVTDVPKIWVYSGSMSGEEYLNVDSWIDRPKMTKSSTTSAGNAVYVWTYTGSGDAPTNVIITWNNENDRAEEAFSSNAYYYASSYMSTASTGNGNNHVIYQLNLYNFTSAGTFKAAQQKLDYLKDLGIDIIWIMPIHTRGSASRIGQLGSPYAPRDYYSICSDHGTLSDLRAFVDAAHGKGMQVWLDWVANHTSKDATWVSQHPEYYGSSFKSPNGYGDVYQLDFNNANMQTAMINAMQYWITNANIDGFRCDYVSSSAIPTSFWTKAISQLKNQSNGKQISILAEGDLTDATRLLNCGWDYDYAWGFQWNLTQVGTNAQTLKTLCQNMVGDTRFHNQTSRMLYLTNHDQNYTATMNEQYGNNTYSLTALMFTLYGMPLIYDGQENGYLLNRKLDYFNRNVIDFNSVDNKMYNTVRTLANLKRTSPALADKRTATNPQFLSTSDASSVMAYVRKNGNSQVLAVINMSNSAKTVTVNGIDAGTWTLVANSKTIASSTATSSVSLSSSSSISVGANGFMVYTKGSNKSVEDMTEDIEEPVIDEPQPVYDIAGRKVADNVNDAQLRNGIYIIGGKKVLIKR